MRASGDQEKISCGNIQLCAGLKANIEGDTNAVVQRSLERVRRIIHDEEEARNSEEEEYRGGLAVLLNNLTIETAGTAEEATEHLEAALGMEVEAGGGREGEEWDDGTVRALGDL